MLKVLEHKIKKPENIEFDVYTPLNIEFGSWNIAKEPTIYWRTGDFKKSLIEIGIGKYTGDIRSITLTLIENVCRKNDLKIKNLKVLEGMPTIKVDQFLNETYIDEKGEMKAYIGTNMLLILFSENQIVSIVQNDHVGFGIDSKNLIGSIMVRDISENEKKAFEEALN